MKKVTFVFHQTEEEQQAAIDRILHMRETWKAHVQSIHPLQHA